MPVRVSENYELYYPGLVAWVRELVRDWLFDEGQGTGTRSGLPYTYIEEDD